MLFNNNLLEAQLREVKDDVSMLYQKLFSDKDSISAHLTLIHSKLESLDKIDTLLASHDSRISSLEDTVRDLNTQSNKNSNIKNIVLTAIVSCLVPIAIVNAEKLTRLGDPVPVEQVAK